MAGAAGYVGTAAFSDENAMVATGSFLGDGLLSADLGAVAANTAATSGQASLDGVTYLNDATFQEISSESLGMRMMGLRDIGGAVGSFDMNVFNRKSADEYSYDQAADVTSYELLEDEDTGRKLRWNQKDPKIQLYLNPSNAPSGMTDASTRDAIEAAANTWDDAVAQNLFIDTNTVIVDYSKEMDNPYAAAGEEVSDGYNVHGWWALEGNTLGLSRYWYNPYSLVDGYESIIESDVWYDQDRSWTTDWNTAVDSGNSIIDLQSVAVHELGHSIGMGDLYTLPASDPRSSDYAQVMNLYDAPQRTLGNGDRTGAQTLYGMPSAIFKSGSTTPGVTNWKQYGTNALYVDVDTSSAGFTDVPSYLTSLIGNGNQWEVDGVTSIYSPTATGFRIYLRNDMGNAITPELANQKGWCVQWVGIPKNSAEAGSTTKGSTDWKAYGDAIYLLYFPSFGHYRFSIKNSLPVSNL
jgi:hypothetical protein